MSVPVFLADAGLLDGANRIRLEGDEGRHAAVVRRIAVGERVQLTDGAGRAARCVVVDTDRNGLTCDVESRTAVAPPSPRIAVVQALPKGDRGETAVETLTEVGVDEILPWSAARCVVRWKGERGDKALRKWRTTAREAAKQARRSWLPEVTSLASTSQVVTRLESASVGIVLHEEADESLADVALPGAGEATAVGDDVAHAAGDVVLVVGPEGGVAPEELDAFRAAGAVVARLGPTVLRTSTAGTVAAGIVLSRTARWA